MPWNPDDFASSEVKAEIRHLDTAAYQNTDDGEVIAILAAVRHCANSWDGSARLVGNVRARDISRACTAAIEALQVSNGDREAEAK